MKVLATGAIHPVFRLYDSATQNRGVWSRMPEFYWAAAAERGAPAATVLAQLEGAGIERPLIAEQYVGRGRVLFLGTDSTYRWRRNIGDHLFYRFWGQAIRHMTQNKRRSGDTSWMQVYPARIEPGESIAVELYAVDREGNPLERSTVTVQVTGTDMVERIRLDQAGQAGRYRGNWQPPQLGQYRLGYTDARHRAVTAAVQVASSGRELRRPIIDRDALALLAEAGSGGLLEIDEIDRLPELLQGEPQDVDFTHQEEIWDNWLTLLLLVGLYCTDVGVRRLSGLT